MRRNGSDAAEIITGARNRIENGLIEAARQEQQRRELEDVEAEDGRRRSIVEPLTDGKAQPEPEIEQRRHADAKEAPDDRQVEAEADAGHQNGDRLAGHRQPSQTDQRVDAQPARALAEIVAGRAGRRRFRTRRASPETDA